MIISVGKTGSPREIYDGEAAKKLTEKIVKEFIPAFGEMQKGIQDQYGVNLERLEDGH